MSSDIVRVEITGIFPHFYMKNGDGYDLLTIENWGNQAWKSMSSAFLGCEGLIYNATDVPDLSLVTDMSYMFFACEVFNENIDNWNTSNVINMSGMFYNAHSFNQPISNWNTANVTNMSEMFRDMKVFNQPIGNWNTSKVTDMSGMFYNAGVFDQNLSGLELNEATNLGDMLYRETGFFSSVGPGMSRTNYDATLIGWATQNVKSDVTLGANGRKYCESEAARNTHITKGWTFSGDMQFFAYSYCSITATMLFKYFFYFFRQFCFCLAQYMTFCSFPRIK